MPAFLESDQVRDEEVEATERLLEVEEAPITDTRRVGSRRKQVLSVVGLVAAFAMIAFARGMERSPSALSSDLRGIEEKADSAASAKPTSATEKKRTTMQIEGDLGMLVTESSLGRGTARALPGIDECGENARALFDKIVMHSGLHRELSLDERLAFRDRFTGIMDRSCQKDPLFLSSNSRWLDEVRQALEEEKPVMTEALAHNLNSAGSGWTAQMQPWMVHESKARFGSRLGRTATLPRDANVSRASRPRDLLPRSFSSATRWSQCQKEILRVHDQGICGSCWAFSCSQVLDARICIQSSNFDGNDAAVAPGFFASCAAHRGYPGDGCSGGWEYFCYQYIDRPGTPGAVSETCSPYFGVGSGINHFKQRSTAPECPSGCQEEYPRTLAEDGFKLPGVSAYKLYMPADQNAHMQAKEAIYRGGPVNHGIYASGHFMGYSGGVYDDCNGWNANHAVVTYGWFSGGYLSKNSWGENWGEGGLMRLADCIITDFTIPGDFSAQGSHIPYPLAPWRQDTDEANAGFI